MCHRTWKSWPLHIYITRWLPACKKAVKYRVQSGNIFYNLHRQYPHTCLLILHLSRRVERPTSTLLVLLVARFLFQLSLRKVTTPHSYGLDIWSQAQKTTSLSYAVISSSCARFCFYLYRSQLTNLFLPSLRPLWPEAVPWMGSKELCCFCVASDEDTKFLKKWGWLRSSIFLHYCIAKASC